MTKHILLIGGSYGIGKAIVAQLLDEGNKVTVASRTAEDLPIGARHIPYDVMDTGAGLDEVDSSLDGFVYCPGSIDLRPFSNLKEENFKLDMEINFHGMVRALHLVMSRLKKGKDPSILLFSTVAVHTGMAFHTSIAAAKGAVEGFGRALASELAPTVRVNIIAPSLVDTPLAKRIMGNERMRTRSEEKHPMKRAGRPDDIAAMACLLLSVQSSWTTGQVIHIDGGIGVLKKS